MFSASQVSSLENFSCLNLSMAKANIDKPLQGMQYDTRLLKDGEIFVAIKGEKRNGHDFMENAIELGAAAVLVNQSDWDLVEQQRKQYILDRAFVFSCYDTTSGMAELGNLWRRRFPDVLFFAVTGSNGKTTTKDFIAKVLVDHFGAWPKVVFPEESLNNHIGVPKTLSNITEETTAVIVEVGTNHFGELEFLAKLTEPKAAMITNIGDSHLEFLIDREGVFRAKRELFDNMIGDKIWFINLDDEYLRRLLAEQDSSKHKIEIITYSSRDVKADFYLKSAENKLKNEIFGSEIAVVHKERTYNLFLPIPGVHNRQNALACIAVCASYYQIPIGEIVNSLSNINVSKHRSRILKAKENFYLYDDAYNANPTSMQVAIDTVAEISNKCFSVALGEMKEVGDAVKEAHRDIGEYAVKAGASFVFSSGPFRDEIAAGARKAGLLDSQIFLQPEPEALLEDVRRNVKAGGFLLVKGSRGAKMERLIEKLV